MLGKDPTGRGEEMVKQPQKKRKLNPSCRRKPHTDASHSNVTKPIAKYSIRREDPTIAPGGQCLKLGIEEQLGSQDTGDATVLLGCVKTSGDVYMVMTWLRDPFLRRSLSPSCT